MDINPDDMIKTLNICLATVEKQRVNVSSEEMKSYFDGYRDACKMLIEEFEKRKKL